SARTGLIGRSDSNGESTRFSDYRNVDGELVPFSIASHGPLGDKTLEVKELTFGPSKATFGPLAKLTR
ncbi:MAG TPA: hypothetical protein VK715_09340, partial [Steroidobacteraceae bacterium]|nr:hypothetical protein [Steroidobacteraceae bacterium]